MCCVSSFIIIVSNNTINNHAHRHHQCLVSKIKKRKKNYSSNIFHHHTYMSSASSPLHPVLLVAALEFLPPQQENEMMSKKLSLFGRVACAVFAVKPILSSVAPRILSNKTLQTSSFMVHIAQFNNSYAVLCQMLRKFSPSSCRFATSLLVLDFDGKIPQSLNKLSEWMTHCPYLQQLRLFSLTQTFRNLRNLSTIFPSFRSFCRSKVLDDEELTEEKERQEKEDELLNSKELQQSFQRQACGRFIRHLDLMSINAEIMHEIVHSYLPQLESITVQHAGEIVGKDFFDNCKSSHISKNLRELELNNIPRAQTNEAFRRIFGEFKNLRILELKKMSTTHVTAETMRLLFRPKSDHENPLSQSLMQLVLTSVDQMQLFGAAFSAGEIDWCRILSSDDEDEEKKDASPPSSSPLHLQQFPYLHTMRIGVSNFEPTALNAMFHSPEIDRFPSIRDLSLGGVMKQHQLEALLLGDGDSQSSSSSSSSSLSSLESLALTAIHNIFTDLKPLEVIGKTLKHLKLGYVDNETDATTSDSIIKNSSSSFFLPRLPLLETCELKALSMKNLIGLEQQFPNLKSLVIKEVFLKKTEKDEPTFDEVTKKKFVVEELFIVSLSRMEKLEHLKIDTVVITGSKLAVENKLKVLYVGIHLRPIAHRFRTFQLGTFGWHHLEKRG